MTNSPDSGEPKPIPLKELYNLEDGQVFIRQQSVTPRYKTIKEDYAASIDPAEHKRLQVEQLIGTGIWDSVDIVDELHTRTGEPTGNYGFVVTRKNPAEKNTT